MNEFVHSHPFVIRFHTETSGFFYRKKEVDENTNDYEITNVKDRGFIHS